MSRGPLRPEAVAARIARGRASFAARFWAKVEKTDGCWLWRGARMTIGYGRVWVRTLDQPGRPSMDKAHRVAYELAYGPIPAGRIVCHRCDNPPCVRPDHLYAGTPAENIRDFQARGVSPHGPTRYQRLGAASDRRRQPPSPPASSGAAA